MCAVSYVGDMYAKGFKNKWDHVPSVSNTFTTETPVTREEFEDLRQEVVELRKLLQAAKAFDKATGQPDCEMDKKVDFIKSLAEFVGVDMAGCFWLKGTDQSGTYRGWAWL